MQPGSGDPVDQRPPEGRAVIDQSVDRLGDKTAEYYDTHDISADMQAGEWSRHEGKQPEAAMSGFNTRLPTAVLNDARAIARARGMATGAWMREVIEAAVARQKEGDDMVPISVLLAAAEEYQHRRAS